jgi:glutathione synthase/RimK-type ligase-like ATP-grasp enzyme
VTARVVLATCADLPSGDEDAQVLCAALSRRRVSASWQVWDDPRASWDADIVVIRSTWDYSRRRDEFLNWTRQVRHLANPSAVVAWNSDKNYLRGLAERSVPVVPTGWVPPGIVPSLPSSEFVLKPSVGAGSRGAARFDPVRRDAHEAAYAHLRSLHDAGHTVMVQPYLSGVDHAGETALIYFDGQFSHAVRKSAMLPPDEPPAVDTQHGLFVTERIARRVPSAAELALGARVLDVLPELTGADLLYARVDLLPTSDGPVLVELEVTEPSLFMQYDQAAADRFAAAIARWAGAS